MTEDDILELLEGDTRLVCISISDPYTIKELSISITQEMLKRRKRQFKVKPHILFVFDEAQEFIRDLSNASGIDRECMKESKLFAPRKKIWFGRMYCYSKNCLSEY